MGFLKQRWLGRTVDCCFAGTADAMATLVVVIGSKELLEHEHNICLCPVLDGTSGDHLHRFAVREFNTESRQIHRGNAATG